MRYAHTHTPGTWNFKEEFKRDGGGDDGDGDDQSERWKDAGCKTVGRRWPHVKQVKVRQIQQVDIRPVRLVRATASQPASLPAC